MRLKAIPFAALAAALALSAAPVAMAAQEGSITLNAATGGSLDGHTYSAYRIGTYENAVLSDGKVSRVDVINPDDSTKTWLSAALTEAGVDRTKGCDEAGTIAHLTDAGRTRAVANALAGSDSKPASAGQVTGSGATATLDVPEGLYLVVDSDGQAIIVGTKIDGLDLTDQILGVANVKVWSVPISLSEATGATSTNVGDTREFRASFVSPSGTPSTLVLTLGGQGLSQIGSVTAKAGSDTQTVAVTGGTADLTEFAAAHPGEEIELDYAARVISSGPSESAAARSDATLSVDWSGGVTRSDTATVRLLSFRFGLDKVAAADTSQHLSGAGFVIKGPDGWLVKDGDGWSSASERSKATEFTTGDDGLLKFEGLKAGTYTLAESTVPDGFWSLAKPSLTVTVSDDGTAVVKGVDEPNLTEQAVGAGDMDGWTVARVKNVNGISQLPSTGGVGTALTVAAAFTVAAALLGLSVGLRRLSAR